MVPKKHVRKKDNRTFTEHEIVGLVPRLPDAICDEKRWSRLVQGRRRKKEPIHLKEARVVLMQIRHAARASANAAAHDAANAAAYAAAVKRDER